MFARSWPFDSNRMALVEELSRVTVAFCVARVRPAPVPWKVMALAVPTGNRNRSARGPQAASFPRGPGAPVEADGQHPRHEEGADGGPGGTRGGQLQLQRHQ